MSMSSGKQSVVRPPQRGIFPLDHYGDCQAPMKDYLACLESHDDAHHQCKEFSRNYLQCRMDHDLMARENLDQMGFSKDQQVRGAREYDHAKEKAGYIAGKHIDKGSKWWWQSKSQQG